MKTLYRWGVYKRLGSAAETMCPEQKQAFANTSLTGNTVAQQVKDMTENLQENVREKVSRHLFYCSW